MSVRSAAKNISDENIIKLEKILDEMKILREQEDYENYSKRNRLFHEVIYSASENKFAVSTIKSIKDQLIRFQFKTMMVPGRSDCSIKEHTALFEALRDHDEDAAALAIAKHIDNVVNTIIKYKDLFI